MPVLTPQQIQDDQVAKLKSLGENVHASMVRGNDTSTEYRKTLTAINDKIILISIGSVSLLVTFIGILFSSDKSISDLEYQYIVIALITFLISVGLLLVSRWSASVYSYHTVHKYYLQDLKKRDSLELRILQTPGTNVNSETYEIYTSDEIAERIKLYKNKLSEINKGITKNKKNEKFHDKLSKRLMIAGYVALGAAYIFTIIFFIGVIGVLNT